jgi:hypothetical protein
LITSVSAATGSIVVVGAAVVVGVAVVVGDSVVAAGDVIVVGAGESMAGGGVGLGAAPPSLEHAASSNPGATARTARVCRRRRRVGTAISPPPGPGCLTIVEAETEAVVVRDQPARPTVCTSSTV